MVYFTLNEDDKRELREALILRFREGEFGPVTFRMEMRKLQISDHEIDAWRDAYIDECAANMRAGR